MNKRLLSIILVLFILLAVGCSQNNTENVNLNSENEAIEPSPSSPAAPRVVSDLQSEKIQGDIKKIYYADGNKVLLSADKLYLYDLSTGDISAEAPQEAFEWENYWAIESGYVAVRETLANGSGGGLMVTKGENSYIGTFYDHSLRKVSEFDFNQFVDDDHMFMSFNEISFSADGGQVAYATSAGLYLYDFEEDQKTTIIDLESEDAQARSGIVTFEQIGFTNQDKRIAFKAQSFDIPVDAGKPSFDTCGIVNVDGSGLSNKIFGDYICKELTAYNTLLLFAEDVTIATGRILLMETLSDKTKIYPLTEEAESGNISGSDSGRYFAVSVSNKSGWKIRMYNTETGELEAEQQVSSDEEGLYMAHDPIIKVIDDTRTCIVLLGSKRDDIETKMIVSQF